ncbi:hypothetical protein [Streptomyces purpurogeneiscleroticus]|uniref:hypothetical protein n=1 Tax=Streptomyces purpurogeneiscleroticus TaxID=68259 RepID=UPI001CBE8D0E|nr:hypothetical protein [Streptomyces purpurogeneiscleroticus]
MQPASACPRGRRLARRCRLLIARLRAVLWRCVTLFGVDFGKGFAYTIGATAATGVVLLVLSVALDEPLTELIRAHLGL